MGHLRQEMIVQGKCFTPLQIDAQMQKVPHKERLEKNRTETVLQCKTSPGPSFGSPSWETLVLAETQMLGKPRQRAERQESLQIQPRPATCCGRGTLGTATARYWAPDPQRFLSRTAEVRSWPPPLSPAPRGRGELGPPLGLQKHRARGPFSSAPGVGLTGY